MGARTTRATSRRAKRTVGRRHIHDVKQRSVVRSRGALLRPGWSVSWHVPSHSRPPASPRGLGASDRRDSSNSVPPMRGGWSADRRTLSFGRACDARPPCPGATGTSLGAPPWGFWPGPMLSPPVSGIPAPWRPPAPRPKGLAVGVRTSLRCGSRRSGGRHSLLRLSGSSPETPLMSEDGRSYTPTPLRSQEIFT